MYPTINPEPGASSRESGAPIPPPPAETLLTIARFADLTGLAPSALRFYDRRGLLRPARRLPNGYRVYAPEQVAVAHLIHSLRQADVSIADVGEFLSCDADGRRELLAAWRHRLADRLLAMKMADRYLGGVHPEHPQIHLRRWERPSALLWFPATAPPRPLGFIPAILQRRKELRRQDVRVVSSGFVRTLDLVDGCLVGEVGFRVRRRRATAPQYARVQEVPPTLFATLECGIHDQHAAHRMFRFLDDFGFTPGSLHLERYLPGLTDRYQLMVAVTR